MVKALPEKSTPSPPLPPGRRRRRLGGGVVDGNEAETEGTEPGCRTIATGRVAEFDLKY